MGSIGVRVAHAVALLPGRYAGPQAPGTLSGDVENRHPRDGRHVPEAARRQGQRPVERDEALEALITTAEHSVAVTWQHGRDQRLRLRQVLERAPVEVERVQVDVGLLLSLDDVTRLQLGA